MGGIASGLGGIATGGASLLGGGVGSVLGGVTGGLYNGLGLGNGFSAAGVPIQSVTDPSEIKAAYSNAETAMKQQQDFVNALQSQGTQGMGSQTALGNMLMQQAQGQGPNPAAQALANATGANTANQAALMAGQRGASSNPALIARQAAMQGGANQQQAAGQSALMQAQQQLAAQQQLQQLAGNQIGQTAGGTQQAVGNRLAEQQALMNAVAQQNNAMVGAVGGQNQVNAGVAAGNQASKGALLGNLTHAGGSAMGMADGGMVDDNNPVMPKAQPGFEETDKSPRSKAAQFLMGGGMARGGQVPAMVSPGEIYLPPSQAKQVAAGKASPMEGEKIAGQAKVKGDSLKNDTVPKTLEAGGIVIPRSVVNGKDAAKKAAAFVTAHLAKHGKMPKKA